MPPEKIENCHFEKSIDCMVLKPSVYVRYAISFFYKPNPDEIPIFVNFFWRNFHFWFMFYGKSAILKVGHVCDVIRRMFLLILVCVEKGDPMVPIRRMGVSLFKFTGGGYRKGLVRRGI